MKRSFGTWAAGAAAVIALGWAVPSGLMAGEREPAIGGYCPVAYVKMHQAVKGDPAYRSEADGQVFLFSAPAAKKMFDAEPEKYRVAYHGWCATGIAMGRKITADPTLFTVHDGVTYLFSSAEAKAAFDKAPAATVARADARWAELK